MLAGSGTCIWWWPLGTGVGTCAWPTTWCFHVAYITIPDCNRQHHCHRSHCQRAVQLELPCSGAEAHLRCTLHSCTRRLCTGTEAAALASPPLCWLCGTPCSTPVGPGRCEEHGYVFNDSAAACGPRAITTAPVMRLQGTALAGGCGLRALHTKAPHTSPSPHMLLHSRMHTCPLVLGCP